MVFSSLNMLCSDNQFPQIICQENENCPTATDTIFIESWHYDNKKKISLKNRKRLVFFCKRCLNYNLGVRFVKLAAININNGSRELIAKIKHVQI